MFDFVSRYHFRCVWIFEYRNPHNFRIPWPIVLFLAALLLACCLLYLCVTTLPKFNEMTIKNELIKLEVWIIIKYSFLFKKNGHERNEEDSSKFGTNYLISCVPFRMFPFFFLLPARSRREKLRYELLSSSCDNNFDGILQAVQLYVINHGFWLIYREFMRSKSICGGTFSFFSIRLQWDKAGLVYEYFLWIETVDAVE